MDAKLQHQCRTCGEPATVGYVEDIPDGVSDDGSCKLYRPGMAYYLCDKHRHPVAAELRQAYLAFRRVG